jgi:methionine--tRNA ligase beta chain
VKEEPDPRSEHVPDPPVSSLDELREKSASVPVSSGAVNGGTDEGSVASPPATISKPAPAKPTEEPPSSPPEIDFSKLDVRVGVITKAWPHEDADRLYCEEIDLGEKDGPRRIASGLRDHYSLEELEGRRVLVVANLKARKLAGFSSHGMVLCAVGPPPSDGDGSGSSVRFVEPPEGAAVGERVYVEGYAGEPATENQLAKKKMLEHIFPDLRTDGAGVATYRGSALLTSAGPCAAPLPDAGIS